MNQTLLTIVNHGLLYGGLLSALLSIMIVVSLWVNPEMWLHDAPKEVQEKHGPMSAKARQQRAIFGIPFFAVVIGVPWWALYQLPNVTGQPYTFGTIFTTLIVMFMLFNLVDLVVIDWLIVERWRPSFLRRGRLGALMTKRYYLFHFTGFCKGSVGLTLVSLLIAGVMAAVT